MKRFWHSQRVRTVLISFLALLGVALCSPIGWTLILAFQVAPLPEAWHPTARFLEGLTLFLPLVWLLLCVGAPVLSIVLLISRKHRQHPRFILVCFAAWIIAWGSLALRTSHKPLRKSGLMEVAQRARPLIEAIEAYRVKNGQYPTQLNDLVPTFIDKVPYTGAVGYPKFEYQSSTNHSLFKSYEVRINTPIGLINWDVFVYWPEEDYPSQVYGGGVERIGDWAYVHE